MRAAVDCGEMDRGEVREKTVMGNACGGKLGSHGSKAILLSHEYGVEYHYSLSLSLHTSIRTSVFSSVGALNDLLHIL